VNEGISSSTAYRKVRKRVISVGPSIPTVWQGEWEELTRVKMRSLGEILSVSQ